MTKRLLSLILCFAILIAFVGCAPATDDPEVEEPSPDSKDELLENWAPPHRNFQTSLDEVSHNYELIQEHFDQNGIEVMLLEGFPDDVEIEYIFGRLSKKNPTTIDEFFDGSRMDYLSYSIDIDFTDNCPDAEDCWYEDPNKPKEHKKRISVGPYVDWTKTLIIDDPELLTMEYELMAPEWAGNEQCRYSFKYDGIEVLYLDCCTSIDDELIDYFREKILATYGAKN